MRTRLPHHRQRLAPNTSNPNYICTISQLLKSYLIRVPLSQLCPEVLRPRESVIDLAIQNNSTSSEADCAIAVSPLLPYFDTWSLSAAALSRPFLLSSGTSAQ